MHFEVESRIIFTSGLCKRVWIELQAIFPELLRFHTYPRFTYRLIKIDSRLWVAHALAAFFLEVVFSTPTAFLSFFGLGHVIHALYIIIHTTYIIILECYWIVISLFLHVLDDFWDFHSKSLFLVFNFREAANPFFLVFNVLRAIGTQMEKGKLHSWFFIGRLTEGRRLKREEPRGPKEGGPCGHISWTRGTH